MIQKIIESANMEDSAVKEELEEKAKTIGESKFTKVLYAALRYIEVRLPFSTIYFSEGDRRKWPDMSN